MLSNQNSWEPVRDWSGHTNNANTTSISKISTKEDAIFPLQKVFTKYDIQNWQLQAQNKKGEQDQNESKKQKPCNAKPQGMSPMQFIQCALDWHNQPQHEMQRLFLQGRQTVFPFFVKP